MLHGRTVGKAVEYQAGFFAHDGDNARTSETEGARDTLAGRIVFSPLSGRPGSADRLKVGAAAAAARMDSRLGIAGRTAFGDGVPFHRVTVNGQRLRLGVEAASELGPVSLTGEYMAFSDEREDQGLDGQDLAPVEAMAWYVAGTWVLTGERKHGRVTPRRSVSARGFGAVELAARLETMSFAGLDAAAPLSADSLSALQPNAERAVTFVVNWYLDRLIRLQGNVVVESIDDPQRSPAPRANGRFVSTVFRLQVVL
jgi:phosphate-selective porin